MWGHLGDPLSPLAPVEILVRSVVTLSLHDVFVGD